MYFYFFFILLSSIHGNRMVLLFINLNFLFYPGKLCAFRFVWNLLCGSGEENFNIWKMSNNKERQRKKFSRRLECQLLTTDWMTSVDLLTRDERAVWVTSIGGPQVVTQCAVHGGPHHLPDEHPCLVPLQDLIPASNHCNRQKAPSDCSNF